MKDQISLKSLVSLWTSVAMQLNVSQRSVDTVLLQCDTEHNAIEFLTKKLPSLGSDLDRALSSGTFILTPGFFKKPTKSPFPHFLKEIFIKIFDKNGNLRPGVEIAKDIKILRTLCYFTYKFEFPITDLSASYEKFKDTDKHVKTKFSPNLLNILKPFVAKCCPPSFDVEPRHSNGATACKADILSRRLGFDWNLVDNMFSNVTTSPTMQLMSKLQASFSKKIKRPHNYSRFTCVPKDARGPRGINIEQHERMFFQQQYMHAFYDYIQNDSEARGFINFDDQTINQELAKYGSVMDTYSTIDLKDASDLVSWELVKQVFPPEVVAAFTATRSPQVEVDGEMVTLKKFASMGSALCFPVEAILFWSIARTVCPFVWVYGDDIIVPSKYAKNVIIMLKQYGLRVNLGKTLLTGPFKESCGGDFFRGQDIVPYRLKKTNDMFSFIDFTNNMGKSFGDKVINVLVDWYKKYYNTILPVVDRDSVIFDENHAPVTPVILSDNMSNIHLFKRRWNPDYQVWEYRLPYKKTIHKRPYNHPILKDVPKYRFCTTLREDGYVRPLSKLVFAYSSFKETILDVVELNEWLITTGISQQSKMGFSENFSRSNFFNLCMSPRGMSWVSKMTLGYKWTQINSVEGPSFE